MKDILRDQLLALLDGGHAHMPFDMIVAEMPLGATNSKPPNFNYTPWHLLEHMRLAQHDILEFIRDPEYQSPPWPEGFWPPEDKTTDEAGWQRSVSRFQADLAAIRELVRSKDTDFFAPIPHARDYTIFREVLVVADHNAYHLGELITLRQVLHALPPEKW
jgi:hypothetical protein